MSLPVSPDIGQGQAVVLSYTDPTAGDDDVALEDALGHETPSFTTGMSGVPAVTNNSEVVVTATTGAATISGAPQVGQTLTAVTTGIRDPDGLTTANYMYQWIRVDGATEAGISGENSSTYTLLAADLGKTIKVRVTFTDDASNAETRTSVATATVIAAPPTTCGMPDFGSRRNIWTGALTVEAHEVGGIDIAHGFISNQSVGALAPTTFYIGLNPYTVDGVGVAVGGTIDGDLQFGLTSDLTAAEVAALRLHVCDTTYDFSAATHDATNSTYTWADDLDWSGETTLTLYLSRSNNAPVFSSATPTREIAENTAADQNVGAAVTATDADTGDTLAYTLGGDDMASFDFVGTTGQILTKSGVSYDFEAEDSYTVTVTASDGTATAVATVTISITDVDEPPVAPATPTVTAVTDSTTSLTVSWIAPANAGRPDIESYDVQYRAGSSGDWSDGPEDVATTPATVPGLVADTDYEVRVRATNAEGDSGWSDPPGSGRTNSSTNNAPVFSTAMPARSIAENTASGQNVGDVVAATDADGDTLTYTLGGADMVSFDIVETSGQIRTKSGVSYDHEAKDSYTVTVTATDTSNATAVATVTIGVTDVDEPPDAPAQPTVNAVSGSTTSLSVSWAAPANAGKPVIDNYDVQYRESGAAAWINGPQNVTTTTTTISGLTADTLYEAQVRATNAEGDSGWSDPPGSGRTNSLTNNAPVFNPSNVSRSIAENTAAGQNVGAAVTATDADAGDTLGYELGGTDAAFFDIVGTSGQIRTKTNVSYDFEAKSSYTVTVRAFDGTATADASVTISITDVDEPPSAPATPAVSAVSGSTTSLSISWAAPANAGRPAIDNYDVQYRDGTSRYWTRGPQNVTTTTTNVTGLVANTLYQARIRATNAEGNSGWSSPPGAGRTNALGVAQTGALVSNTGQDNSGHRVVGADEYAQPFDTGNNSGGYSLTGIVLDLQAAPTGTGTLTITVREDSSSDSPVRAALYTLANPALASGLNEFQAPGNAELHANTTYWVVATYSANSGGPAWYRAVRPRVDAGAAERWAIDAPYKIDDRVARDGWAVESLPRTLQIAVKGTVIGGANTPPRAADNTVATAVDTAYTFSADDFGFADTDPGDTLASVRIVTAPTPGTLALDGTAVLADAVVTKAQIDGDMLTFTPVAGATGAPYTTFTFKVNDGTDDSVNTYTMTIDVTAVTAEPPRAPATPIVSAVSGSSTSLSVSWAAPANAGRPAIVSYDVQYRVSGATAWTDGPQNVTTTTTTTTIASLVADTLYEVQIRATNAEGDSGWSTPPGSGRTNAAGNNAPVFNPSSVSRSIAENTSAGQNVGAEVEATDGDDDTLSYTLGGTDMAAFEIDGDSGQLRTISGVSYDHEAKSSYTVTVTATDTSNATAVAIVTISVTDVNEPPDAPATPEVSAVASSTTSLTVSWTAPANAGKPAIANYDVQYQAGSSGRWSDGPQNVTGTTTTIRSLTADTRYQVRVRAANDEGDSGWSTPPGRGRTNAVAITPPGVVGLTATATVCEDKPQYRGKQYGCVTLTWDEPDIDPRTVLVRMEYRFAESGSALPAGWRTQGSSDRTDRLSQTIDRLKLDTLYIFEVRVVVLEGPGPAVSTTIRTPAAAVETGFISLHATQSTAIEGGTATFEVHRCANLDNLDLCANLDRPTFVLVGVTDSSFPDIPALGGPRGSCGEGGCGAGGRIVKFKPGEPSATGTITVEFDGARPTSRSLTVTLASVERPRYFFGTPTTLSIAVTDRDAAVSVRDTRVREATGAMLEFVVTLDRTRDREVMVNYATSDGTATQGDDYTRTAGTLVFSADERSKTVSVPVIDDDHDEGSETLMLTLSNARGAVLGDATATGTIVNSDPLPDAWLSRFGRVASDHVVQSIGRRLEGGQSESHLTVMGWRVDTLLESTHSERDAREPRPDAPGRQPEGSVTPDGRIGAAGAMAGGTRGVDAMSDPGAARPAFDGAMTQGVPPLQDGTLQSPARAIMGGLPANAGAVGASDNRWLDMLGRLFMALGPNGGEALATPGLRDMVMGSSFYYGYSPDAGLLRGMNRLTAWGESASTRFSGAEDKLSLDGEVNTAIAGADGEWGRWLAGLALSYSEGEGGYRQDSAKGGAVSSTLSGVNPYARYRLNERASFWGTLGYGSGRLTLTPDGAESSLQTDMTNAMAAFGGRGVLSMRTGEAGRFELAVRSDAMLTDTVSDAVLGLAAGEGATGRIRLILEGTGSVPAFGGVLAPKVEAGLRYDGGDAETGAGLEVGGGLAYDKARLTVQVDGRVLLTHRDRDYEEWGYSLSFAYQPGEDGRGLRYQAGSQWGATQSGVQSLWSLQNAGGLANGARTADGQRYTAELGYGFGVRRLWYPYVGTESGGASSPALRFGLKLNAGSALEAGLEIGRRAHISGEVENDIRLQWQARW